MSIHHEVSHLPENTIIEVFLDVQLFVRFEMESLACQVLFKVQKDLDNLSVWSSIPFFKKVSMIVILCLVWT
jgi:hypothetical protein